MKKLIVSAGLALLVMAVTGCTCSRDKGVGELTPPEGACAQGDQLGSGSCDENSKKIKMEKRRALKIDPRRFTLNRDLLNGTLRKKMEEEAKQPPAPAPAQLPAVKPVPAVKLIPAVKPAPAPVPTKK